MWRFLLFVFVVFGGASFYIYMRYRPLLPNFCTWRGLLAFALFFGVMFAYFIGSVLQMRGFIGVARPFVVVGSWAMSVLLYSVLIFFALDVLRLLNLLILKADFLNFRYTFGNNRARLFSFCCAVAVAVITIAGYLNAKFPSKKQITLKTEKHLAHPLRFVLVSDVHLGMVNSDNFFRRLAIRINAENADFVLIAGDFFDGDPKPVFRSKADEILKSIHSKYGIYAVPGNHEYIGNAAAAMDFMRNNGVFVLCDSVAKLPCSVSVIGRDDRSAIHAKGGRSSIENLVSQTDTSNYLILLDHQPYHLEEAEKCGIDLQLSGHTHNGQLWPLNYITSAIYECSFGKYQRGNTNYYVSAGYGTWGPPIRTSCRPEMIVVEVNN